jgi:site-specific DNA-methyltransferase (adenine-specific)
MPDASVDSIVTDPPYLIGFMGKGWDAADGIAGQPEVWAECLRVLKPGGHLLAFGATRTYHRMTVAIEDAGFDIRDSLHWVYGSGFPKSLDVSKAIDKAAGAEREVVGMRSTHHERPITDKWDRSLNRSEPGNPFGDNPLVVNITAPATDAARQWSGWGTALKPAHEPIVVARKPLTGTVAANVLAHGTGALNIDGCRVGSEGGGTQCNNRDADGQCRGHDNAGRSTSGATVHGPDTSGGRWPANLVFTHAADCADVCADGCPVAELDGQSGNLKPATSRSHHVDRSPFTTGSGELKVNAVYQDGGGGASRFFTVTEWDPIADVAPFRYVAKPSKRERNAGLDGLPEKAPSERTGRKADSPGLRGEPSLRGQTANPFSNGGGSPTVNHHPTVKPVALMRWLVRLVTPLGGTVLDPFAGSGTTLVAAVLEGFDAIGIEMTDDYLPIIEGRVAWAEQQADKMTPTLFDDAGQGVRVTSLAGASIDPTGDATPGQGQV